MRHFDEPGLLEKLERLPPPSRVAFAAACATRLLPAYGMFCVHSGTGNHDRAKQALDSVWSALLIKLREKSFYESELAAIMELIPAENQEWCLVLPPAEDAIVTMVFALRTILTRQSQEAVFAARRVYDSLDYLVKYWRDPEAASTEPDILGDPVIQTEFARQERDMTELSTQGTGDYIALFGKIKTRAEVEPAVFPELVGEQ